MATDLTHRKIPIINDQKNGRTMKYVERSQPTEY